MNLINHALAASASEVQQSTGVPDFLGGRFATPVDLFSFLFNLILSVGVMIAFLGVLYGGFLYLTAGQSGDGAEKGKQTLMYAIISLIILFLTKALVSFVIGFLAKGA